MVNIITNKEKVKHKYINDNESFFKCFVRVNEIEEAVQIIKSIDNAELLDENTGLIKTPFGLTSVDNLSTGCKTALNVAFIKKHSEFGVNTFNITECGYNALEVIFSMNDIDNLLFYLGHSDSLFKCADREYCVDGVVSTNLLGV